jgi:hypothetical protein
MKKWCKDFQLSWERSKKLEDNSSNKIQTQTHIKFLKSLSNLDNLSKNLVSPK